jgi:pimeloyl-ACP methyl ester carboxylesterase
MDNALTTPLPGGATRTAGADGLMARLTSVPVKAMVMLTLGVAALAAVIAALAMWSKSGDYRVLYANLSDKDGGAILGQLSQMNVPYKHAEGGNAIHPDAKGNLYIDPKVFPSAVAADLPPEIAAHLANSQLPLNHVAFEAPVDIAAWHDKPTFYVISTKDKVLAPEAQKSFAARIHAQTTEVAGSHASLVVHAKQVAEVIEKAALAK